MALAAIGFAYCIHRLVSVPLQFEGIAIRGNPDFRHDVIHALHLLKARSPQSYDIVTNYIRAFAESEHSGMAVRENPPTSYLHPRQTWVSIDWFAASIAHESLHSKLYHDYLRQHPGSSVPDEAYGQEPGEKLCCEHQTRVLKDIGASDSDISASAWNPSNQYWKIPFENRDW